jgi:hypothetical protein
MGDVFLRAVYMVIDGDKSTVALGAAQAPPDGAQSESTAQKGAWTGDRLN